MKADKLFVLDADSHWSEPGDLFTSRAPAAWRDRVPRVEKVEIPNFIDGHLEMRDCWVCDGTVLGLMPHPERAAEAALGGTDGVLIFNSLLGSLVEDGSFLKG